MREITEAEKREMEDFLMEEQLRELNRRGFKIVKEEPQISEEELIEGAAYAMHWLPNAPRLGDCRVLAKAAIEAIRKAGVL